MSGNKALFRSNVSDRQPTRSAWSPALSRGRPAMSNHRLMRHAACLAKYPGEDSCAPAATASCRSCVSPSALGWLRVDRPIQTRPHHQQTPQQTFHVWPLRYAVPAATNRGPVEASCGAVAVDDIRTGLRGAEGYFMIAQYDRAVRQCLLWLGDSCVGDSAGRYRCGVRLTLRAGCRCTSR